MNDELPGGHRVGDHVYVRCNSWAGRSRHLVIIEKICPKRVKVRWDDKTAFRGQRVYGHRYYVPRFALVGPDGRPA